MTGSFRALGTRVRWARVCAYLSALLLVLCGGQVMAAKDDAAAAKTDKSSKTKADKATPKAAVKKKAPKKKKKRNPDRFEWGVLPAIAGNTDTGVGFGVLVNLAQFKPGFYPYRWRIELLVYMTAKEAPDGGVELPFHDYYIYFDLPGLAGGNLRIDGKVGFSRFSTAGYFGLGNGAIKNPPWLASQYSNVDGLNDQDRAEYLRLRRFYQYDRIYPAVRVNARYFLPHKISIYGGAEFTFNWINLYQGSLLEQDLRRTNNKNDTSARTEALRDLLFGVETHPQLVFKAGLLFDNRNHEFTPSSGMFHDLSVRFSPGAIRYPYAGITLSTRWYFPIFAPYLTVAIRLLGDVLFGRVPFYEQARFGGLYPDDGTGGSVSVRGIVNRRYHGNVKILGNFELRSKLIFFNIGSARFNIGLVAFFDALRVWADLNPRPSLDGEDFGLKMAFGGGLRIQWGESFIVRADVGYSITENKPNESEIGNVSAPIAFDGSDLGIYITVGQAF